MKKIAVLTCLLLGMGCCAVAQPAVQAQKITIEKIPTTGIYFAKKVPNGKVTNNNKT